MVWTSESSLKLSGGDYDNTGTQIDGSTKILDLYENEEENTEEDKKEEKDSLHNMETDTAAMNMLIKDCINNYKDNITSVKYNGKTASECNLHDICVENSIADSTDYYTRKIEGTDYSMIWAPYGNSYTLKVYSSNEKYTGTKISFSWPLCR